MDIYWYGQSMFKIKGKNTTLVIDPFDPDFTGLKFPKDVGADVVLATHLHQDHNNIASVEGSPLYVQGPGEYEVKGVSVVGINSFHDLEEGKEKGKNTIYHIVMDNISIVHLGDLGHLPSEEQTSGIDSTDILMIPVGGKFTIDDKTATKVVAQFEPKVVIPMHYGLPGLKLELEGVEGFLKEMGAESVEPVSKLSVTKDKLPEETMVVLLSKSS